MFGLSLFRPSRQSNPSPRRSHVGRSKIQISPSPGEQDWSNPGPTKTIKSPLHALPPRPLHRLYVDRCIKEMRKKMRKTIWAPPPPLQSKFNCLMFHSVSLHLDNGTFGLGRVRVSCVAGIREGRKREFGGWPRAHLALLTRPKSPFLSLLNTCHAG